MFIDPIQVLQVGIYSKVIQEFSTHVFTDTFRLAGIICALCLYKMVPWDKVEEWVLNLQIFAENGDRAFILVPSHKKTFTIGGFSSTKQIHKTMMSPRFRGLIYYILKYKSDNISSLAEITKSDFDGYAETGFEYILLPYKNNKIEILDNCCPHPIYIKFTIQETEEENDEGSRGGRRDGGELRSRRSSKINTAKQFSFEVETRGANNIQKLSRFLENIEEEYTDRSKINKRQVIYELIKTQRDEDDITRLVLHEYPFKSNKNFDNIFYDEKSEMVQYIGRFVRKIDADIGGGGKEEPVGESLSSILANVEECNRMGMPNKGTILLYGEPGTGKSCTIRAILNMTKRHGLLVSWSSMKTKTDFRNVIRAINLNGTKYSANELCIIFEDFDANDSRILKSRRENASSVEGKGRDRRTPPLNRDQDQDQDQDPQQSAPSDENGEEDKSLFALMMQKCEPTKITIPDADELTLDYVLSCLDGVIELDEALIIFTTNHLSHIDPAFLRPGRIDYMLELKRMSVKSIREMVQYKYEWSEEELAAHSSWFDQMRDYAITPADAQSIFCKHPRKTDASFCLQKIIDIHQ